MNRREPRRRWEREAGEGGSVGIKTERGKRKEMERGSFAQPSITFLGFKFIWLHSFLFFLEIHSTQEREREGLGMERKRENSMRGGDIGRERGAGCRGRQ